MKAKNFEVMTAHEAVAALVQAEGIGARAGFRIARLARALDAEVATIREAQQRVAKLHAKKDDKGEPVTERYDAAGKKIKKNGELEPGQSEQYVIVDPAALQKEIVEMMEVDVEVAAEALPIDDLEGAVLPEGWTMTRAVLALGPFVTADE